MHYDNKIVPQNVKYAVRPGRNVTPLTATELEIELYELDAIFKRPTYEEQKKWLLENTTLFVDEGADDMVLDTESMKDLD